MTSAWRPIAAQPGASVKSSVKAGSVPSMPSPARSSTSAPLGSAPSSERRRSVKAPPLKVTRPFTASRSALSAERSHSKAAAVPTARSPSSVRRPGAKSPGATLPARLTSR